MFQVTRHKESLHRTPHWRCAQTAGQTRHRKPASQFALTYPALKNDDACYGGEKTDHKQNYSNNTADEETQTKGRKRSGRNGQNVTPLHTKKLNSSVKGTVIAHLHK